MNLIKKEVIYCLILILSLASPLSSLAQWQYPGSYSYGYKPPTNPYPHCGDGIKNLSHEQCEPNNNQPNDSCPNMGICLNNCSCALPSPSPRCGDGIRNQSSEECEPNNNTPNSSCSGRNCLSNCKCALPSPSPSPRCGDGIKNQTTEECEPNNNTPNSSCSGRNCLSNCKCALPSPSPSPRCGDGIRNQTTEECEPNNYVPNSACEWRECLPSCKCALPVPSPSLCGVGVSNTTSALINCVANVIGLRLNVGAWPTTVCNCISGGVTDPLRIGECLLNICSAGGLPTGDNICLPLSGDVSIGSIYSKYFALVACGVTLPGYALADYYDYVKDYIDTQQCIGNLDGSFNSSQEVNTAYNSCINCCTMACNLSVSEDSFYCSECAAICNDRKAIAKLASLAKCQNQTCCISNGCTNYAPISSRALKCTGCSPGTPCETGGNCNYGSCNNNTCSGPSSNPSSNSTLYQQSDLETSSDTDSSLDSETDSEIDSDQAELEPEE